MIVKLSQIISRFLSKNGVIPQDEIEVYSYSFEILLSTLINTLLIAVVALFTHSVLRTFVFAVTFFCLRRVCGGVHASTHFVCISSMMCIYALFLLLSPYITLNMTLALILSVIELLAVFFLAPVEDFNKPLSSAEKAKYKLQSRVYVMIFVAVALLFLLLNYTALAVALQFSLVSVCSLLLFGRVKNHIALAHKV